MKLFNTLTRRKEEFVPLEEGKVRMYVCGPTVYNLIHIGNARPMIIFDTVRRYMEYKGYEVNYVSNFTDVDDKIIKKAIEEGVSAQEISERYIAECKKDMDGMNVKPATTNPQATQEINGMISMIQTLVDKGYAYPAADGTVYFRVKKFKEYGKLSHKNLDDLQVLRFFMLNAHYRSPLNFSADLMEAAKNALERITDAAANLKDRKAAAQTETATDAEKELLAQAQEFVKKFEEAMDDDFNTADALAAIFELVKFANTNVSEASSAEFAGTLLDTMVKLCDVLGLKAVKTEEILDKEIEDLIAERQEARKAKNFARADEIRDELLAKGIILKDTREGVKWKRA